jgi:hypothetical protein
MLHDTQSTDVSTPDAERKLPLHWAIDRDVIDLDACLFLFRLYPAAAMHVARVELRYNFLPHVVQSVTCWSALSKLAERRVAMSHTCVSPTATPAATTQASPGSTPYNSGTHHALLRIMLRELRRHADMPPDMTQLRRDLNWQARGSVVMCVTSYRCNSHSGFPGRQQQGRHVDTHWSSKAHCGAPLHHTSRYHSSLRHTRILTHICIFIRTRSLIHTHIVLRA